MNRKLLIILATLIAANYALAQNFRPAVPYPAGTNPFSVVAAYLDGDAYLDLAVANYGSNNVSILIGYGDGTFITPITPTYPAGSVPRSVVAADLNGDGFNDLAVANEISNNVSILINDGLGTGTFLPAVNYPVESAPRSVFAADFNGDGYNDLAVANYGSDNVSILIYNNGTGTFQQQPGSPYAVGDGPYSIFAADLDGVGSVDLAVANENSGTVSILKDDGTNTGTFLPAVNYPAGTSPISVYAADLDNDTFLDLAVANWTTDVVSVLRNDGSGAFTQMVGSPYPAVNGPCSVIAADLDGDGDKDLAATNWLSYYVSTLMNNGNGTFQAAVNYPVGGGPRSVCAADFNSDGCIDLAVANHNANNVSILMNLCVCPYIFGDINANFSATELSDILYALRFFQGYTSITSSCNCPPYQLFAPGDADGNCVFNGVDVAHMVGYFWGGLPLIPCPSCTFTGIPIISLNDPYGSIDDIWLDNTTGLTIDVDLGEDVPIAVLVVNDENVPGMIISFKTENQYVTPEGGTFSNPLNTWDFHGYRFPLEGYPLPGYTTQTLHAYKIAPISSYYLNTSVTDPGSYRQIATFMVKINPDPLNVGQSTVINMGDANPRVGPSVFCNEDADKEWIPELHPVTLNILAGTHSIIAGRVFNDLSNDCVQDPGESGLSGWTVSLDPGGNAIVTDNNGNYSFMDPGVGTYTINLQLQANWQQTCPLAPPYYDNIVLGSGVQIGGKNFGVRATYISGMVYNDIDRDCSQDLPDEIGLRNWTINLSSIGFSTSTVTDINGNYIFMNLAPATYEVSEELPINWDQTCPTVPPGTHIVPIIIGDQVSGKDFGVTPNNSGPVLDLACYIGGTRAIPGNPKRYGITYRNVGSLPADADVSMTLPVGVSFYSCYPQPCNCVNQVVTWPIIGNPLGTAIPPGVSGNLTVIANVDPGLPNHTPLQSFADITTHGGDSNPQNNHATETQIAGRPFDPNEKLVTPQGIIALTDQLIYQIDFQNIGTAPATDVFVTDILDPSLDISTFTSGASIHPYTYTITGRQINWIFANINLPDINTDNLGSQGFVQFSIYPLPGVPLGTNIENNASIVFDSNSPVVTNTVINTIGPIPCSYVTGDANNSNTFTGLDITYAVRFFKGGPLPPYSCNCPPHGIWYVSGDVNGSCTFTGLDITYMVRYFKGGPAPIPCPDCPPLGR